MGPRRLILIGGAGIAFLGAVAVALILWLGGSPAPMAAGPGGPDATTAAPPALVPQPPGAPAPLPSASEPPVSPPRIGGRPHAAASVAWEQVPTAARLFDLGPGLAAPVNAALKSARDTMDTCFEEDTRLLASRPAPKYGPDELPTGPAVLVLRLESRAGGLDVVDTEVESLGTSTRELVECARHVLKGWPVAVPNATGGIRYRLIYLLQ